MNNKFDKVRRPPTAPPVYRPQPVPAALQKKRSPGQPLQTNRAPIVPAVYRPEPKSSLVSQMKTRPVAPPVYRPQPTPKVLQTKRPIGSPGAIQRSQILPGRGIGNVVQRDLDLKTALRTENSRYLIDPADNTVLYSVMGAIPPRPSGLYQRTMDQTSGYPHIPLNAWRPNVRFLSKEEALKSSPVKGKPGQYEYTQKGFIDSVKRFSLRGLGGDVLSPPEVGERPTIGVFGKNDCYAFGDALQNLMHMNGELPLWQTGRKKKNVHVTKHDPRDLELQVGDMMRHIYVDNPHCKYHAATVVAKDGESLVTLEGHVSKNLKRPQFLIHGGVRDFASREVLGGYGDEVEITPLESLNPDVVAEERDDFVRRFQRMMGDDTEFGFMTAQINLGFARTDEFPRRIHRARLARQRELEELRRGGWVRRMHKKWERSLQAGGRTTMNNSIEGNRFIDNDML